MNVKNGGGRDGWEGRIRLIGMEVVVDGMVATEWWRRNGACVIGWEGYFST